MLVENIRIFLENDKYDLRETRDNSEIYFPISLQSYIIPLRGCLFPHDRGEGERHLSVSVHRHRKVKAGRGAPPFIGEDHLIIGRRAIENS